MIIPLHHGKAGPTRSRRSWPARARAIQRRQPPFDQEASRPGDPTFVGGYRFNLLIGGVILLLVSELFTRHFAGIVVAGLIMISLLWSKLTMRRWGLACERRAVRQEQASWERECQGRAATLQQLNLRLADCSTIAALERQATECVAAIAHTAALVQLSGVAVHKPAVAGERAFQIPISGEEGQLIVFCARNELDLAQQNALEQLGILIGVQAARLRGAARLGRQQKAMMALWEITGILRSTLETREALSEACRRMATALDLNWLALLAHDERQLLAPLLLARGPGKPVPHLTGAQIRVAAEALRTERALIRSENQQAFSCLPIRLLGDTPVILAAHGEALDAATQALLMLMGETIVERLARPSVGDQSSVRDIPKVVVGAASRQPAASLAESSLV
ncbi:MAG TPA: hypothetical protein VFO07_17065 [Roseiflexaceae bacterium]|nr:hypothetical protein [Roseiflexaceae bacterium]